MLRSFRSIGLCFGTLAALDAGCRAAPKPGSIKLVQLRVESRRDPIGLDAPRPSLRWQIEADVRGVRQAAYEIRVARSEADLTQAGRLAWESGKVSSDQSVGVPYGGPALGARQRYYWQVRVEDTDGRRSAWSEPAFWEMGLRSATDWSARWIESAIAEDSAVPGPSPLLRKDFTLRGKPARARVYVTSLGVYDLRLNGTRVGNDLLTPGWTDYTKRIQYQTYDVTALLRTGPNAVGAILGDGWYRGTVGFFGQRHHYGDKVALLLQLEVTYDDGRTEMIGSDETWKAATGPILHSDLYAGEAYDARLERSGWDSAGYDDHTWSAVKAMPPPAAALIAQVGPPVRRIEEITPVRIFTTPDGLTVADLGQNMVGWIRLRVAGPAGTTVTLRHAEALDQAGNFYTANLRLARQTIAYTLKGGGPEVFEPHFTFQGFRFVAIEGYPGKLPPGALTGIVIHSDLARTGEFETSNQLVNQLQHNILWSQKGNFVDLPTDCPQRDERMGWTGDAQVFASTAAFNMDSEAFFRKWLGDLAAEQLESGSVPWTVPDILRTWALRRPGSATAETIPAAGAAGWSDAATIIPWTLYLAYGDRAILEAQYRSMVGWVGYQEARAGADHLWDGDDHLGDWLDFFSIAKNTRFGSTSTDLIATAYYAHSADLVRQAARVLGENAHAVRYGALFSKVREAFQRAFVAADGTVGEGTQTAYVLALDFDLLPEKIRPLAAAHLAEDVRSRGHLTTGFLGTPRLLAVLTRFGYLEEAYRLFERREFPSWLYPVTKGATTVWERWDGVRPDGSFQTAGMNSFNHYAYGAVGEWMYSTLAGIAIDPEAPGYRHVVIAPRPGGAFTWVKASHAGPYGEIRSEWKIAAGRFQLVVVVPPNSTATVRLPGAELEDVTEGDAPLGPAAGVSRGRQAGGDVVVEVGSGRYLFEYPSARR